MISEIATMPPMSHKNLGKEKILARNYRNRRVGDFLKELELTEGRGTGFPKIRRAMKRNGSPKPVFETDEDLNYFLVQLPVHEETELIKQPRKGRKF